MKPPLVSVVVPAYNASKTIVQALKSVIHGGFEDFEIVVCDDASTDGLAETISQLKDSRIHVIRNNINSGEGASRDRAIESASGRWIALLDADDAWAPNRLQRMLNISEDDEPDYLIFDDMMECHDTPAGITPWRSIRGKYAFGGTRASGNYLEIDPTTLIRSPRLIMQPIIPRKFIIDHKVKHSSLKFGADTEFILNLLSHGLKMRYVPEPMYLYRIAPGSMSASASKHKLMRLVLENAKPLFMDNQNVIKALDYRTTMEANFEAYRPFLNCIKERRIFDAIKMIPAKPWLPFAFFRRALVRIPYEIHRIAHGGRRRS